MQNHTNQGDTLSLRIWVVVLVLLLTGFLLAFLVPMWISAEYKDAVVAFGSSLMTAGILVLIVERITTREIIRRQQRQLAEGLGEIVLRERGFDSIATAAPYKQLITDLQTSNSLVIVQTWCPQIRRLLNEVEPLIARGGKIEIFLLAPDSHLTTVRSKDLDEDIDYVQGKIRADESSIRQKFERIATSVNNGSAVSDSFRLYYYDALPTCSIYKTDQRVCASLYWHGRQSDDSPHLILRPGSDAAELVEEHIAIMRSAATLVDLSPRLMDLFPTTRTIRA